MKNLRTKKHVIFGYQIVTTQRYHISLGLWYSLIPCKMHPNKKKFICGIMNRWTIMIVKPFGQFSLKIIIFTQQSH